MTLHYLIFFAGMNNKNIFYVHILHLFAIA